MQGSNAQSAARICLRMRSSALPAEKKFVCSWTTGTVAQGYFRLQVWATVNLSGLTDAVGELVIEGRLASEELVRYVRE